MATAAQVHANRMNALHSTGPRTDEGKAASSRNALTHGLNSTEFIVRDDEQEAFAQLRDSLLEELRPETPLARHLFSQLLHAAWTMHRVHRIEAEMVDNLADPLANDSCRHQLDLLARYHARAERSYYRALKELREHTTNLYLRDTLPPILRTELPGLAPPDRVHRTMRAREIAWRNLPESIWEEPAEPNPPPQ